MLFRQLQPFSDGTEEFRRIGRPELLVQLGRGAKRPMRRA